ncbi:MAG: hypothetical protein JWM85_2016 [Acidimicrobiaceae bacterium]|nr:hypothetical protein [Acidimicrobiaceae bacterium]
MPMREECKHFQSRTYASGETARFCVLDLAPEAPWRCPDDCARYERRSADVGWIHGSLVEPAIEDEPIEPAGEVAHLLDEAEDIVNAAGPEISAEVAEERRLAEGPSWRRALRRMRRRGTPGPGRGGEDDAGFGGRR